MPNIYSVMSPNGTLMAYSTPVDIKDLRDQAALVSMAWKEHEANYVAKRSKQPEAESDDSRPQGLETLTIEFENGNIIVRALQPKLLLVVVGAVPPSRKISFKITPEAYGDQRYPPVEIPASDPEGEVSPGDASTPSEDESTLGKQKLNTASIISNMSQKEKDVKIGALHIQRKKIDVLTEFIRNDFDEKGFVMPDDSNFP